MSKGSKTRVSNTRQYADNYERIFSNGEDRRKWGFATSSQSDSWQQSDATTRDEAIQEGRDYYGGEAFGICRCTPIDIEMTLPSADDICEQMSESAGDNYGWVDDFPDVSQAGLNELNELLKEWARKYVADQFWMAEDIEEIESETP